MSKGAMIFVAVCLVVLVLAQIRAGDGYSWEPSYEATSTDPLGSKAFVEWLATQVDVSDKVNDGRLEETLANFDRSKTLVVITDRFDPDAGSRTALLKFLREGGSVVLAAEEISDSLATAFEIFDTSTDSDNLRDLSDTNRVFNNSALVPVKPFMQPSSAFWWSGDSVDYGDDQTRYGPWEPLFIGSYGEMLAGRRAYGKGELTQMMNPKLFTNYAILYDDLSDLTEAMVQHFPDRTLVLDAHYKPRKSNRQGLLFTVTQYPALQFTYTTALIAGILFVLLGIRRRQRPIPTIDPPINTSIEFALTVAQMYEVGNTRADIAERLAHQVARVVRRRTGLRLGVDSVQPDHVAQVLGLPQENVAAALEEVDAIRRGTWEASAENFRAMHQRLLPIIEQGIS